MRHVGRDNNVFRFYFRRMIHLHMVTDGLVSIVKVHGIFLKFLCQFRQLFILNNANLQKLLTYTYFKNKIRILFSYRAQT